MENNLLIIHGGAPTAVMNASTYGVIREARKSGKIDSILGANGGTSGVLRENFIDLGDMHENQLERLLVTPGTIIGTSRTPLDEEDYSRMHAIFLKHQIRYVLFNGGNGTMDACGNTSKQCAESGIQVVGIPKTIDNDIAVTDHSPGFGSAARYLAATVNEICQDVQSLPIHVSIVEALGRNAGWLAAASSLASEVGYGPDLIYLPERAFSEEHFLDDISTLHKKQDGIVVVVSEGLRTEAGKPIVEPIYKSDRAIYYGDVSAYLANLIIRKLGIKARNEKPGLSGRASIAYQSVVDRDEAILCGENALRLAISGVSGIMVTLERETPFKSKLGYAPIEQVMMNERILPDSFINVEGNGVTGEFREWCYPLIGGPLPSFLQIRDKI